MSLPVSLQEVASEMDLQSDLVQAYINRSTGEVISITEQDKDLMRRGYDPERDSDWQQDVVTKTKEVLEAEDFLELPSQWDIHEYKIMERFCRSVDNDDHRAQLLEAIDGKGAFQRFKRVSEWLGLREDYYAHKGEALRKIAAWWLNEHEIPYVREEEKSS